MNKTVLITRAADDAQKTAQDLAALGFKTLQDPMLTICGGDVLEVIPPACGAVIITSRNALPYVAEMEKLSNLPAFIVGAETAALSSAAGFKNIMGIAEQSRDLPNMILARIQPVAGSLLHLTSQDAHTEFYDALLDAGYGVEQYFVYKAQAAQALNPETIAAISKGKVDCALFYSARTAGIFEALTAKAGLAESLRGIEAFCLSAAVAGGMQKNMWKGLHCADKPTHQAMMDCLANWR